MRDIFKKLYDKYSNDEILNANYSESQVLLSIYLNTFLEDLIGMKNNPLYNKHSEETLKLIESLKTSLQIEIRDLIEQSILEGLEDARAGNLLSGEEVMQKLRDKFLKESFTGENDGKTFFEDLERDYESKSE